jgi:hypothetical protein
LPVSASLVAVLPALALPVLSVAPALGRAFTDDDDRPTPRRWCFAWSPPSRSCPVGPR